MKPFFLSKSQTFGVGQTIWADKFWGIWGIFSAKLSAPILVLSINQPLFLQKTTFISKSQIFIWNWDWDLNLCRKEFGI
jgi:hypothetical protein